MSQHIDVVIHLVLYPLPVLNRASTPQPAPQQHPRGRGGVCRLPSHAKAVALIESARCDCTSGGFMYTRDMEIRNTNSYRRLMEGKYTFIIMPRGTGKTWYIETHGSTIYQALCNKYGFIPTA